MNILLIVNASPWGSTLASTALRFARAALASGDGVPAVYFQGDGVYNALPGRVTDPGASNLAEGWAALAREHGVDLMLCSSAAARRWNREVAEAASGTFREAGLAELVGAMEDCPRVVSF